MNGKTLRELYWMAMGKAEFLGMTKGTQQVMPYDPSVLKAWAG